MTRATLSGFAVDLGGTKIAAGRFEEGRIVVRLQTPTEGNAAPDAHMAVMADLLDRLGWQPGRPLAVAVAGRIETDGLWSAVNPGTLAQVAGFDLAGALAQRFGGGLAVNDDAATWAETHLGAGLGLQRLAYVTVSTGVGGGSVLEGRFIWSPDGLAGHLGFMSACANDKAHCECGRGCTV
jgi:N-acylmannosamine kinase